MSRLTSPYARKCALGGLAAVLAGLGWGFARG
jgi:hypothetical protein